MAIELTVVDEIYFPEVFQRHIRARQDQQWCLVSYSVYFGFSPFDPVFDGIIEKTLRVSTVFKREINKEVSITHRAGVEKIGE